MKLKLTRYSKRGKRRRESDYTANVDWNIEIKDNCLFIQTENNCYDLSLKDNKWVSGVSLVENKVPLYHLLVIFQQARQLPDQFATHYLLLNQQKSFHVYQEIQYY